METVKGYNLTFRASVEARRKASPPPHIAIACGRDIIDDWQMLNRARREAGLVEGDQPDHQAMRSPSLERCDCKGPSGAKHLSRRPSKLYVAALVAACHAAATRSSNAEQPAMLSGSAAQFTRSEQHCR